MVLSYLSTKKYKRKITGGETTMTKMESFIIALMVAAAIIGGNVVAIIIIKWLQSNGCWPGYTL